MQSSLSKIIIWLIVAVALVGAAFMLWLYIIAPVQRNIIQNTPSNSPGTSSQTSTTPGQSQTTAPPATYSAIEQAYDLLFQKISAQRIIFTTADSGSPQALGGVYALYASDVTESKSLYPNDTDFPIEVSFVDLDKDGTPEAIVYNDMDGFCGSGGCGLDIYKVEKNNWSSIFSTIAGGDVGLSASSTKGYSDLFLSVHGDGPDTNVVRYAWDGKTYQPQETVATWDGATFNLPQ